MTVTPQKSPPPHTDYLKDGLKRECFTDTLKIAYVDKQKSENEMRRLQTQTYLLTTLFFIFIMGNFLFSAPELASVALAEERNKYVGPFGLTMGMKLSAFKNDLKEIGSNNYETSEVPNKHSAFFSYLLLIGPKNGLCKIVALGKPFNTSIYGDEIKSNFENMESKLNNAYGKNKKYDFLRSGSIWSESSDWMMGLLKGERYLSAYWGEEHGSKLKANISSISLNGEATSRDRGTLILAYEFYNLKKCKEEKDNSEDGAL